MSLKSWNYYSILTLNTFWYLLKSIEQCHVLSLFPLDFLLFFPCVCLPLCSSPPPPQTHLILALSPQVFLICSSLTHLYILCGCQFIVLCPVTVDVSLCVSCFLFFFFFCMYVCIYAWKTGSHAYICWLVLGLVFFIPISSLKLQWTAFFSLINKHHFCWSLGRSASVVMSRIIGFSGRTGLRKRQILSARDQYNNFKHHLTCIHVYSCVDHLLSYCCLQLNRLQSPFCHLLNLCTIHLNDTYRKVSDTPQTVCLRIQAPVLQCEGLIFLKNLPFQVHLALKYAPQKNLPYWSSFVGTNVVFF